MARTQPDAVEQTDNVVGSDTGPDGDIKQPDEQQWGTRKKISSPELWKKSIQRRLRSKGQPYEDYKGRIQPGKSPQPCNCVGCRYRCSKNIPEEVRRIACSEYWVLNDFHRQKDYIMSRIIVCDVKRRRVEFCDPGRKQQSVAYYFNNDDKRVRRVCKKFFTKTLSIGHAPIDTAIKQRGDQGTFVGEDKRGKQNSNNTHTDVVALGRAHIESFPKIESHYTRSDTKLQYLNRSLSI